MMLIDDDDDTKKKEERGRRGSDRHLREETRFSEDRIRGKTGTTTE